MADAHLLDLRGLRCPLPVLRLEATVRRVPEGTLLTVRTDDPLAAVDIPHAMATGGYPCRTVSADAQGCVFEVTAKR